MTEPDAPRPLVSVIMVNWNVADLCVEAVKTLYQHGGIEAADLELFVIDNASSDDSLEILAEGLPEVPVIANTDNLGFGGANNQVFEECRGRYLFLLNPDTVMRDQALRHAIDLMEKHDDWGILGLRLLNPDGTFQRAGGGFFPQLRSLAWNYFWLNRIVPSRFSPKPLFLEDDPQGTMDIDWVSGAALLIRPEACKGMLFDDAYWMYGEDIDLCQRVAANGYAVKYTSEASITHLSGQSVRQLQSEELLAAPIKGPRAFYQRNNEQARLWLYDSILAVGYGSRWIIYNLMRLFRPGRDYGALARMSRQHLKTTLSHFGQTR